MDEIFMRILFILSQFYLFLLLDSLKQKNKLLFFSIKYLNKQKRLLINSNLNLNYQKIKRKINNLSWPNQILKIHLKQYIQTKRVNILSSQSNRSSKQSLDLKMLSLNQLSLSANEFDQSKNWNTDLKIKNTINNRSNSQSLFKKCKALIQQQMQQINSLIAQNQQLKKQIDYKDNQYKKITNQMSSTKKQYEESLNQNQVLHTQINKNQQITQSLKAQLSEKQNQIKLFQNKISIMSNSLEKTTQQKQNLKTKCQILQENIHLMGLENNQINQIVKEKDLQIVKEIQSLKKLNSILKRRNHIDQIDRKIDKNNYYNNLTDRKYCKPFSIVEQERFNKFGSTKLDRYNPKGSQPSTNNRSYPTSHSTELKNQREKFDRQTIIVNPFSIIDRKLNTSPFSRIKKNIVANNPQIYQNISINNFKQNQHNILENKSNLIQNKTNSILNREKKSIRQQSRNQIQNKSVRIVKNDKQNMIKPIYIDNELKRNQISRQAEQIKKQILQQYNKVEMERQKMTSDRVSQTLKQLQNKLQKMNKICLLQDSQSQLQ